MVNAMFLFYVSVVTMSDASVNINQGPVTLTCTLRNASEWSLVTIGFTKVNETSTKMMANVTSAGVVTSSSWVSLDMVSFQMSRDADVVSISMTLTQALCSDLGNYSCQIISPFESMRGTGQLVTLGECIFSQALK